MMEKKKNNFKYYIGYTIIFVITCLACFYVYYSTGKSFIYDGDGWSQHYKAYIYYGNYLRDIFKNLFVNHQLVIPQWDFSIGEGAGVIETFHYYVIGDPIAFLTVFVPEKYTYIFYNLSIILRLYLSGLFFSFFCFYNNKSNHYAVLAGSITYVFCFWSIFNTVRHIYFLNPMVYLPLVLLGVDRVINDDKYKYLLTFSVCISCLSNFYFFYNIVILTVIYAVVRVLFKFHKNVREIIFKILSLFKYSLFGVLLGAVILLPIIAVFLGDSRMGIDFNSHLFYPLSYYLNLPSMFISTTRVFWLCMGYATPVIFALVETILNFKNNKELFVFDFIFVLMILFPIFGKIMNGNSYISNKWCYGASLLVAYNLVYQWDNIKSHKLINFIIYVLVSAICIIFGGGTNIIVPLSFGLVFILLYFVKKEFVFKKLDLIQIICILLVVGNVSFNAYWRYAPNTTNYIKTATTYEDDAAIMTASEAYEFSKYIEEIDNSFFRYSGSNLTENASILFKTSTTEYYWSLSNPYISQYRTDLGLSEYRLYRYWEYDKRSTLYTLANVKYYITPCNYSGLIPNNFSYFDSFASYDLYINDNYLPFGYTYENTYSYDLWQELTGGDKENVLQQYLVIENGDDAEYESKANEIKYNVSLEGDVEFKNNEIHVKDTNAKVVLEFDDVINQDLYLTFKGFDYDDGRTWIDTKTTQVKIYFTSKNGAYSSLEYSTKDDKYYIGRTNFDIYFGQSAEGIDSIEITFSDIGYYSFDNMELNSYSTDSYAENIEKLAIDTLENVEFSTNQVKGTIDLSKDKYLLLSIPYSKGWTAYVDGVKMELLNANVAYSAIKLESGYHEIELKYSTPYLKEGLIISTIGIILVVIDSIISRKKYRNEHC